jgi:hypothetical protein
MRVSLDPVIANRIDGAVEDLCSAFSGEFDPRQISELMDDSVNQLADSAVVLDFLPSLAYRLTRERLNAIRGSAGEVAKASWDVVFVSLSGGGRGQIAAALTTLLSGRWPCIPPEPRSGGRSNPASKPSSASSASIPTMHSRTR